MQRNNDAASDSKEANNSLLSTLPQSSAIQWPEQNGTHSTIAAGILNAKNLSIRLLLPQPKHDLDWLPSVAVPDEKKMEWTFKGVPGDPTKQWGRVVVAKDKADAGILAFERADDCPAICAFVPFAIVIDSKTIEITFSQLLREYSFPNASSTLGALKKSAPNESPKPFLLSDMPGVLLQSCVTGGTETSCSVAGRLPQNEHDRLALRWQPVTRSETPPPPYWSEYVLSNGPARQLQLFSLQANGGKPQAATEWFKNYESNKLFDTDKFVDVAFQVLKSKVDPERFKNKLRAAVSLPQDQLVQLRSNKRNWDSGSKDKLKPKVLGIQEQSAASFAPITVEFKKSSAKDQPSKEELIIVEPPEMLLNDWGSLVLKYASNGCNRLDWGRVSGSRSASLIIQENAADINEFLKPNADSKDRNLALALYIVANLELFLRESSVTYRQASSSPDSNYLSTPQMNFFGPKGEVVLEWEFRHRTPFDERRVTILKVVPGSTTP